VFRKKTVTDGYITAISMRRMLVTNLYDKVVILSLKSMTQTNSGKLISLISSDLVTVESGLAYFGVMLCAPFVNVVAYVLLANVVGVKYTLVAVALWVVLMLLQYGSTEWSKRLKSAESALNDERLKLVNDLVVGSRVIKCYGWEHHYVKKVNETRKKQMKFVMKLNIIQSLSNSIFQNMGLIVVLIILLSEWKAGNEIKNSVAVAMLSMIYYVFFAVNTILYMGLVNV